MDKRVPDEASALHCAQVLATLAGVPVPMPADALAHVRVIRRMRGERLFDMGAEHPFLYVIRQGCVKNVYRNAEGEEWIQDFLAEGAFFGSVTALSPGGVCSYGCEAVEDSELECIDYRWIESMAEQDPAWRVAVLNGWKDYATRKEWREHDLLTLGPQARYAAFVAKDADLARRVPQKDLARYLGITPVSLSRIRRRMTHTAQG
jgi:CRP-like cAMP-binding protein